MHKATMVSWLSGPPNQQSEGKGAYTRSECVCESFASECKAHTSFLQVKHIYLFPCRYVCMRYKHKYTIL